MKRVFEQFREIAKTIGGLLSAVCFPVREEYCFDQRDLQRRVLLNEINKDGTLENKITFVSWNILRGYRVGEIKASLSRIVKENHPDILLLQEAPVRDANGFWQDGIVARFNVAYAPLHQVAKKTAFYDFEHSGQLTLSRFQYQNREVYALPVVARQSLGKDHLITRIALYTQIETVEKMKIGIYNVHLENRTGSSGRQYQIRSLLETIEGKNDDVVVVGGDFNTFLGSSLENGIQHLEKAGFKKCYAQEGLLPQLDYLFYRGENVVGVSGKQLHGDGSDHQPILLELELRRS